MLGQYTELSIIDFHNHYMPARFADVVVRAAPPSQRGRWEEIARRLADEALLLKAIDAGELAARVVNIPPALIADPDGHVPHATLVSLNDELAALVARHPGRLHGLASVDAFDGERAGREAERAIRDLGLRGLHVDCARGDLLIDAPQARPTLEVAARFGVPVFVHPVAPEPLSGQMRAYGTIGALFARGTSNSAALIAMVEGGVFAALPDLRVVVTAMAFGGLAMATGLSNQSSQPGGAIAILRKHVWIDTTMCHAALLRGCVDMLGARNVIAGSDWPVVDAPLRPRLMEAMRAAGLSGEEQRAIAAGNVRRLLTLSDAATHPLHEVSVR
jgi:predicted TIM-barrel fold metal-dependent hydrolase